MIDYQTIRKTIVRLQALGHRLDCSMIGDRPITKQDAATECFDLAELLEQKIGDGPQT